LTTGTRRRVVAYVACFLAGAAALAVVALIAGLWNGTSTPVILNTNRVEQAIEGSIRTQRHLTSTVTCPVNIVQQKGVIFYCQAAVRARNFRVVVTEVDSDGHVTFVVT
jgi:hypothetical protein